MRRRELLPLLAVGMIGAPTVRAQQKAMPVIGQLSVFSPPANLGDLLRGPIHQGMGEMGSVEGQNMTWEYRWADFHYDRLPALAADLVSRKVDLIFASGVLSSVLAAKNATSTIPILFIGDDDPVAAGLVASLARPGGNVTGASIMITELTPKRLELLCELVPEGKVLALLVNPNNPQTERVIRDMQDAARAKGVQLLIAQAGSESEIDAAFATLVQLHSDALVVGPDPIFLRQREQIVALAARHAVPASYPVREFATDGGLISYGSSVTAAFRLVGTYAGRILNGAKPADLPVQQPTTFELVVNLKTAKALGLTVPPAILARAEEVIE